MVSYPPIYFVNIEVWVEAENALGKVSSEGINFDPVDKGTYKPEFETTQWFVITFQTSVNIEMLISTVIFVVFL